MARKKKELPKKKPEWQQDPNIKEQQVRQLSPGTQEVRNKPEETLRQMGISRAAGNVPLPPETQKERIITIAEKEKILNPPEPPKKDVFGIEQPSNISREVKKEQPEAPKSEIKPITQEKQPEAISEAKVPITQEPQIMGAGGTATGVLGGTENTFAQTKMKAAEVYDILWAAFTRKKPLKYINAKDSFEQAISIIKNNIDDVSRGMPYINADLDLKRAEQSLNHLQKVSKTAGIASLTWWIDDGMAIDIEILNQKAILEDLKADLEVLKQQQRIAAVNAAYGNRPLR